MRPDPRRLLALLDAIEPACRELADAKDMRPADVELHVALRAFGFVVNSVIRNARAPLTRWARAAQKAS